MLALRRKAGESIVIIMPDGRKVTIFVASIDGNQTRLAFTADPDVKIWRKELMDSVEQETQENEVA